MPVSTRLSTENIVRTAVSILGECDVTFLQVLKEKRKTGYRFKYYDCRPLSNIDRAVRVLFDAGIKVDRAITHYLENGEDKEACSICIHVPF